MRFANFLRLLMLFSWVFIPTLAVAEKRVALVVGNGAYTHATRLNNPVNDAKDVTEALKRLGFEVVQGNDVTNEKFDDLIQTFSSKLAGADIALFYYSGHGLQFDGANYLVPVDSKIEGVYALKKRAVIAQDVVNMMEREAKASLVFLDACRNNTLVRDLEQSLPAQNRTGSGARGLARMAQSGNSLIAFAAAPNDVAADGTGSRNSPFTAAVLKHIETPNIVVPEMLTEVTADVTRATSNRQKPEVLSRLTTQVRLKPQLMSAAATPLPASIPTPSSNREDAARVAWETLHSSCDPDRLKLFRNRYGETYFGDLAQLRIADIDAGKQCAPAKPVVVVVPPPPPPVKLTDDETFVRAMQTELKRVGCYEGSADGRWGDKSLAALKASKVSDDLTPASLAALKQTTSRLCPLKCNADEGELNGQCVAKPAPVVVVNPPKKCDPDENLVNGKCLQKVVVKQPLQGPVGAPQRNTANGASGNSINSKGRCYKDCASWSEHYKFMCEPFRCK
jgi:Caspase domain